MLKNSLFFGFNMISTRKLSTCPLAKKGKPLLPNFQGISKEGDKPKAQRAQE